MSPDLPTTAAMGNSDSVMTRIAPGILLVAVALMAWWMFFRGGDSPSVPQPPPGVLAGPASAGPYLLQPSQIGGRYDQSANQTRATTSSEIRVGQTAAALRVVNSSWKAGAWAGWSESDGSITVISRAEVFKVGNLPGVAKTFEQSAIRAYHGKPTALPAHVPGTGGWFITGRTISPIYSSVYPALRRVAVYGWQHGNVLAVITVTGLPKDDVPTVAATLASAQDQNIGFVSGS
jgi:hypothetical protein